MYVPQQYSTIEADSASAHLLVFQDGAAYLGEEDGIQGRNGTPGRGVQAAVVLDNLIASGSIPVSIAVFVSPGTCASNKLQVRPFCMDYVFA